MMNCYNKQDTGLPDQRGQTPVDQRPKRFITKKELNTIQDSSFENRVSQSLHVSPSNINSSSQGGEMNNPPSTKSERNNRSSMGLAFDEGSDIPESENPRHSARKRAEL